MAASFIIKKPTLYFQNKLIKRPAIKKRQTAN
jgi:hypothetical protein